MEIEAANSSQIENGSVSGSPLRLLGMYSDISRTADIFMYCLLFMNDMHTA